MIVAYKYATSYMGLIRMFPQTIGHIDIQGSRQSVTVVSTYKWASAIRVMSHDGMLIVLSWPCHDPAPPSASAVEATDSYWKYTHVLSTERKVPIEEVRRN